MAPKRAKEAGQGGKATKRTKTAATAPNAVTDVEDIASFEATEVAQIRSSLLEWYDKNHRTLPWRRNTHSQLTAAVVAAAAADGSFPAPAELPQNEFIYYVWVCEIMSQQTQVARAAEYFRRWMARWPTVQALAAASQEEVNELWAGLGYYRRARYLLDGAKYIVGQLDGSFPTTAQELQSIPGVGAYTSAAIASIACGQRVAVVDGNVIRVLARLRRLGGDPRSGAATRLWAQLAEQLLDLDRPGDFNQAVMELGATVCVPNTEPKCGECPVSASCQAYKEVQRYAREGGTTGAEGAPRCADYPAKVEKAQKREEVVAVAVVQLLPPDHTVAAAAGPAVGSFLLVKRPGSGLLAGLWQFPLLQLGGEGEGEDEGGTAEGGGGGAPRKPQQQAPQQQQQASKQQQQQQQQLMDAYLEAQLGVQLRGQGSPGGSGVGGGLRVVERRPLGELVHVFSHIRMTMRVERLVVQGDIDTSAREADEAGGLAALQWVPGPELQGKGLSSGVKKVYKLFCDSNSKAKSKQSITSFFKPKAAAAAPAATADDAASS